MVKDRHTSSNIPSISQVTQGGGEGREKEKKGERKERRKGNSHGIFPFYLIRPLVQHVGRRGGGGKKKKDERELNGIFRPAQPSNGGDAKILSFQ